MSMVGRAGGYALLGSVPLVLVWLIMCHLAPTLLITQKAESNLSRRAPLGSATFFGCECLA